MSLASLLFRRDARQYASLDRDTQQALLELEQRIDEAFLTVRRFAQSRLVVSRLSDGSGVRPGTLAVVNTESGAVRLELPKTLVEGDRIAVTDEGGGNLITLTAITGQVGNGSLLSGSYSFLSAGKATHFVCDGTNYVREF